MPAPGCGAAIKVPSMRLVVRVVYDKYAAAGSSPADGLCHLGTQLSQKASEKLQCYGQWCKEVLREYPLHKLPVPSVMKAPLQQAQGVLSQCEHPAADAARPGDVRTLIQESLAYKTALRRRHSLAVDQQWQAILMQSRHHVHHH